VKFNRGKVLFIFAVLFMLTLRSELAAQTLRITPIGQSVKVGETLNLTATARDKSGNPVANAVVTFSVIVGDGSVAPLVDTTDASGRAYTVFTAGTNVGTNRVRGRWKYGKRKVTGTVYIDVISGDVIPGDLDYFLLTVSSDTLGVSEYTLTGIIAKDSAHNTITGYTNPDTITLSLTGSTADSLQVTWVVPNDTLSGLSAAIPESSFVGGVCIFYVANRKAETIRVTATDTGGHTGTSSEITWLAIEVNKFLVELLSAEVDTINVNDTTDIQVTAVDTFGNITTVGLPMDVDLSASEMGVIFPDGETQSLDNSIDSFSLVAQVVCSGLIIMVTDTTNPSIYGNSNPIEVVEGAGVEEIPAVSDISAKFGSGEILYSVAKGGNVEIKVYNKAGIVVGTLVNGMVKPGYYQVSLKGLNLSSDIYFVVMKGPGITKNVKTLLIK
jgi:hypothetical protein